MSIASLLKRDTVAGPAGEACEISRPFQKQINESNYGVIQVNKIENFRGSNELCVKGTLTRGIVLQDMIIPNSSTSIKDVYSSQGTVAVTQGTRVTAFLSNAEPSLIEEGQELYFEKAMNVVQEEVQEKSKGKFIYC